MTPARRRCRHALTLLCALLLGAAAASAQQDSRYGSWQPPGGAADAGSLLRELRTLVDEAERARAADPRFLQDLRELLARHDRPSLERVLHDDFADGDYTRGTAWTVTAGSFRTDPTYGLVTDLRGGQPAAGAGTGSGKDLAAALITGLLSQYAQPGQQQGAAPAQGARARIETRARVANAFAVDLTVASDANSQRIEFSLFQGSESGPSYVLVYSPGSAVPLELLRRSTRGDVVVGSHRQPLAGGAQGTRRLAWQRDRGGRMTVSVDGSALLSSADQGLRDPFDGFAVTNHGGLFAVREVSLSSFR